jgi:hypothetical protein
MYIDERLHLPTLNIHTELQLTPPRCPATEVRGDTAQRRELGCQDRSVSKSMAGAERG